MASEKKETLAELSARRRKEIAAARTDENLLQELQDGLRFKADKGVEKPEVVGFSNPSVEKDFLAWAKEEGYIAWSIICLRSGEYLYRFEVRSKEE
jgi:hypothetical protein